MADFDWSSLAQNVLPAVVGGLMGARGGGMGVIPGAAYGLSAGVRSGVEAEQQRAIENRRIAGENARIQQNQQRIELDRLDALPKVFQVGQHISENLSEEDRANVVPQFGQLLRDAGVALDDKAVSALLSDKSRLEFMQSVYGDVTQNLPPPLKLKLANILAKDPTKADKLMGEYAFAQAGQIKAVGGDVPDRIAAMLNDDQRLQLGLKTKATLQKQQEQGLGLQGGGETLSGLQAEIINKVARKPDGSIDETKALETLKDMRTNPQGFESRVYDANLKAANGDAKAAKEQTILDLQRITQSRATGSVIGRGIGEQTPEATTGAAAITSAREGAKPLPPSVQAAITSLNSLDRQAENIRSNFDAGFLGPIKGTDTAFEARRRVGSYIGTPLGKQETVFRQSLKDANDMILRARSGAQINEQEAKRLREMLPKATDQDGVFLAGLDRFQAEIKSMLADRVKLGTTPRTEVKGGTKRLDQKTAAQLFQEAGRDPAKARQLAKERGFQIPSE